MRRACSRMEWSCRSINASAVRQNCWSGPWTTIALGWGRTTLLLQRPHTLLDSAPRVELAVQRTNHAGMSLDEAFTSCSVSLNMKLDRNECACVFEFRAGGKRLTLVCASCGGRGAVARDRGPWRIGGGSLVLCGDAVPVSHAPSKLASSGSSNHCATPAHHWP